MQRTNKTDKYNGQIQGESNGPSGIALDVAVLEYVERVTERVASANQRAVLKQRGER
jgi:hypothetical protein